MKKAAAPGAKGSILGFFGPSSGSSGKKRTLPFDDYKGGGRGGGGTRGGEGGGRQRGEWNRFQKKKGNSDDGLVQLSLIPKIAAEQLTEQQRDFAEIVLEGKKNVFITGSAGVGKSFLLHYLVQQLTEMYPGKDEVCVTASTGIAASHINGTTLHSFAGIGLGKDSAEDICAGMKPEARRRWRRVRALIIDEISMLDNLLLNKIDQVAQIIVSSPQ